MEGGLVPDDATANMATDDSNESPGSEVSQLELAEEMEKPWPATFERSIALLASPVVTANQADHFTRSPKPGGTPLSGRRAQVKCDNRRNFYLAFLSLLMQNLPLLHSEVM